MKCPTCTTKPSCVDTREHEDGTRRRRYKCRCGTGFSTIEIVVPDSAAQGDRRKLNLWQQQLEIGVET
jgi:transcriptional regulator NrdR family protein